MGDITQEQKGGKESTNVQIAQVTCGLSYADVKEICLDLFRSNFLEMKDEALNKVEERLEHFTDKYIERLEQRRITKIDELKNPDMQYILFKGQKSYARYGDEELLNGLLELLLERVQTTEKNMIQLNLNEAICTLPKLTKAHINLITLAYLIRYTINNNLKNKNDFIEHISRFIVPFIPKEAIKQSDFQYLTYVGCGNVLVGDNLEEHLNKVYSHIFSDTNNIKGQLIESISEINELFEVWDTTWLHCLELTSVGITIAWSNIINKLGVKLDLNVWI